MRIDRLLSQHPHTRIFGIWASVVEFDGAVYYVPRYGAHRSVARQILREEYTCRPLHELVETVMSRRPGSMVHAGTFFGDMIPSFSRKTPGMLYAFEPVLENYLMARAATSRNELDNVMLVHAGLGAATGGLAKIVIRGRFGYHRGGASYILSDSAKRRVRTQTISLVSIDQFAIGDLSLIQLDVEGYELPVLQGAIETIKRQQPVIVIEDNWKACAGFLSELGYEEVVKVGRDHVYMTSAAAIEFPEFDRRVPTVAIA